MGEAKRKNPPDPVARAINKLAPAVTAELAREWPEHGGYDDLRGAVIYAAFEVLAQHAELWAAPLELVAPGIPAIAATLLRVRLAEGLPLADVTPEHFGCVHETLSGYQLVDGAVAPTNGRRKGGVHFTPRVLTTKVVARTLEPLIACMESDKRPLSSGRLLSLRVCDPSVGAGAFLLEVVRQLGERVLAAGGASDIHEAKRLVAIHSTYGVDKCPTAVYTAKLALRLECRADRMPATWLDDNIKIGDALVGLDKKQLMSFDWKQGRAEMSPTITAMVERAMKRAAKARTERIEQLSQIARSA